MLNIGENHKRALSTVLTMFDELMVSIEKWADGQQYQSVLYEEKNDLTQATRQALKKEICLIRDYLLKVKKDLGITKVKQSALNDIWSRSAAFRENVMEIEAKFMKRYGPIPEETSLYLNTLSKNLLSSLDRILEIIKKHS
jgi:hypothetical protein